MKEVLINPLAIKREAQVQIGLSGELAVMAEKVEEISKFFQGKKEYQEIQLTLCFLAIKIREDQEKMEVMGKTLIDIANLYEETEKRIVANPLKNEEKKIQDKRNYKDFSLNYICLFNYLFISSQMSAKPYFIGSTGILLLW